MSVSPIRICVVTGSRADYGILEPVIRLLAADDRFELQIVATGMHLSPEFGFTVSVIENDGYTIADRVESLVSGDTPVSIAKSIGLGIIGFADVFQRLKPDWILVLGDRYEIFSAVQAAMVANIPIAHIAGGDTTEGAFDEAIRHSITKMAHLHFVTNQFSGQRVRRLGEDPSTIIVVGSPGIDAIRTIKLMEREELVDDLRVNFRKWNVLVTHHPTTLNPLGSHTDLEALLAALDLLGSEVGIFFTRANADTGGNELNHLIEDWSSTRPNAAVFTSLGQQRYLSLMNEVDVVVGNSSSGFYEAPSLHTPTVNIGDRQRGRLAADSVINAEPRSEDILAKIKMALNLDVSNVRNPYGDGYASNRIVEKLKTIQNPSSLLKKRFHMFPRD